MDKRGIYPEREGKVRLVGWNNQPSRPAYRMVLWFLVPLLVPEGVVMALPGQPPSVADNNRPVKKSKSVSVGYTNDGELANARALPVKGPHHVIIPLCKPRGLNYGTQELVDAILHAAREVGEAMPGSPLRVGNLGRPKGGRIPYSVSHRCGRDVDILFHFLTKEGKPVQPHGFLNVGSDGMTTDGRYRLDVERTWLTARAFLMNDEVPVQWIFVSCPIKRLLMEHAMAQGEDPEALARADKALVQPGKSPHDDHFHVRIHCTSDDVVLGCREWGTVHPWSPDHEPTIARAVKRMMAKPLRSLTAQLDRVRAIANLPGQAPAAALVTLLESGEARVRRSAAGALLDRGCQSVLDQLAQRAMVETDLTSLAMEVEALRRANDQRGVPALLSLLSDTRVMPAEALPLRARKVFASQGRVEVAQLAVEALGSLAAADALEPLVERLKKATNCWDREMTAQSLRRITNHSFKVPWSSCKGAACEKGVMEWSRWAAENADKPRSQWVSSGFVQAKVNPRSNAELLRVITRGEEHQTLNAVRLLMERTGVKVDPLLKAGREAAKLWKNWLDTPRGIISCPVLP